MKNVKPMAGQVWECDDDKIEFNISIGEGGLISGLGPEVNGIASCGIHNFSESYFLKCFKFIPQNDLEWLAVNHSKWPMCSYIPSSKNHRVTVSMKHGTVQTHTFEDGSEKNLISESEWQNQRYEFGLDEKPHYTFEDGVWVA